MVKIHTVIQGDTVAQLALDNDVSVSDIVEANSIVFNADRIKQQEQYISEGKLVVDGILIFPGDRLFIPTGNGIKNRQRKKLKQKKSFSDNLILITEGNQLISPVDFTLARYYDSCSDSISFSYPADYDGIEFDFESLKNGLPSIEVYQYSNLAFGGEIEKKVLSINSNSMSNSFAARSTTRLLEKSDVMPNTQNIFKSMSMKDIAEKVLNPFGIKVSYDDSIEDVMTTTTFDKVVRGDDEKPFVFLSRIAKDLRLKVSGDEYGELAFKQFTIKPPVASFVVNSDFLKFVGVESISINYDTTELHGGYVGKLQTSTNDNISKSVESNYIQELTTKVKKFENIKESELADALAWDEQKMVKNLFATPIPYPSWLIPGSDKLWSCGDTISLEINEVTQKKVTLMIKNIIFKLSSSGVEVAELQLIPAETFV